MASSRNINSSRRNVNASRSKIFGASKSRMDHGASSSVAGAAGGGGRGKAAIYLEGQNVTPQSLLHRKVRIPKRKKEGKSKSATNKSQILSSTGSSFAASAKSSMFGGGSSGIVPSSATSYGSESGDEGDLVLTADTTTDAVATQDSDKSSALALQRKALARRRELEEIKLAGGLFQSDDTTTESETTINTTTANNENDLATIVLTETSTSMLLELKSVCVALDSAQHATVVEANKKYDELCASKFGNEFFTCQRSQTLNFAQKNKEVLVVPPNTRDIECEATTWDIYDSQAAKDDDGAIDLDDAALGTSSKAKDKEENDSMLMRQVEEVVAASLSSPGCLLDVDSDIIEAVKSGVAAENVNETTKPSQKRRGNRRPNESGLSSVASNTTSKSRMFSSSRTNIAASSKANNIGSQQSASSNSRAIISSQSRGGINESSSSTGSSSANFEDGEDEPARQVVIDVNEIIAERQVESILQQPSLVTNLCTVERALQQNRYHAEHLLYRNFPLANKPEPEPAPDEQTETPTEEEDTLQQENADDEHEQDTTKEKTLNRLWEFQCDLTAGRTISCMAFNAANEDLLAVSYGEFKFSGQRGGLVLFWSLKNPEYPERVYELQTGVTSIEFSKLHPNLLAVGFYNGVVAVYDTQKDDNAPLFDSGESTGTHMEAVWQVKWVFKGEDRGEALVSISSDGRVSEWSMKKGLSHVDLMILKRVNNSAATTGTTGTDAENDGVISRTASGHCIDFAKNDSSVYFAGTEDGVVHKCSCSYNEQYLSSYFGHTGPVYCVKISPFWPQVFLSCSADWTVKLWNHGESQAVETFHSVNLTDAVNDVAWSNTSSTVFGSVTEDGRVEIWDLAQSTLDPLVTHFPKNSNQENSGVQTTSIAFAPKAPVLAVGDDSGSVRLYQLPLLAKNAKKVVSARDEALRLQKAIYPEGLK